jgi:signal transduction histidine kinase/ActR/RegA family two-component response regulator
MKNTIGKYIIFINSLLWLLALAGLFLVVALEILSWQCGLVGGLLLTFSFSVLKIEEKKLEKSERALRESEELYRRDANSRKLAEEEKMRLEQQLQQAQKMEAIGRLAGGIAHDFNNLLTTISGNADLALLDIEEDDILRPSIEEIKSASKKAADLTRQLLAFSRKQIVEPEVVQVNEIVENLEKMLVRLIGEDIELKTIIYPDLEPIKADSGQIEQILMNLIVNARDAMQNGGSLTIKTSKIELVESYCEKHPNLKPGRYAVITVSDTGCGMDEDTKARIFEPFFTSKPKGEGTGLGLATTFGIVKQHKGHIEVYTKPDVGTSFEIYLPVFTGKVERQKEQDEYDQLPKGTETILLVEDDEIVQRVAIRILERLGYNVLRASNGRKAMALVEEYDKDIDLLITDIVMPGMSGDELAEELKELRPDVKVLYTSGYAEGAVVNSKVLESEECFLGKPYTQDSLSRKVRQILEKN